MSENKVMSDLEIARNATILPIVDIAQRAGITVDALELYGPYKAKINPAKLVLPARTAPGKVVLVSAMSPTPAGEGKSTTTVGLADSLARAGHKVMIALREPSLGPILGMKGGATGGGYSQVLPMDDINLHFTGDFHAITSANNALMALVDNHIFQGNELGIDPRRIAFKRVLDMNDRSLREVVIGLGGPVQGVPRQDGFDITVASEIMAVFCLATDLDDLRSRLGRITFGYTYDRAPVTVADLGVEGALTMLLKDAIKPNLVQTIAGTPAVVHGGPFANIAHGCNSLIATSTAMQLADIVVTEAGFGADLGAEKYMDIKARIAAVAPSAVVVVATIRALKMQGGVAKDQLSQPNVEAVAAGVENLQRHVRNVAKFGISPIVSINKFATDTPEELEWLLAWCAAEGVEAAVADVWGRGAEATAVTTSLPRWQLRWTRPPTSTTSTRWKFLWRTRSRTIVQEIYGADGVEFSVPALKRLAEIEKNGWSGFPVCMAKTQYSFTDDASGWVHPRDSRVHVRELIPKTGAGFIVALTGAVMTMPGLPKEPAAMRMDVDAEGQPTGLF